MLLSYVIDTMTSVHVMNSIKKQLNLGEKMNNKIDDVLDLTREISLQDGEEDIDFSVTEFGDQLLSTNDIEFLWVARNASGSVKNASTSIKSFNDQKIANDVNENGAVRLGDEVFVYSKSYNWKVQDLRNLINWVIEKSSNNEELIDSLLAIVGPTFVPKLKGLDAVSANRNLNPEMIRDTFLYKEWKEKADLKTININNKSAPNWTKDLKHNERKK